MQKYTIIDDPQKAIIIDNYCENYEELCNNFPTVAGKGKDHDVERVNFLSQNLKYDKNIWDLFIKQHSSREYFEKVCLLIEDHLLEWRPKLLKKIKTGDYKIDIEDPQVDYDKIDYEILCKVKFGTGVDRSSKKQHGVPDIFTDNKLVTSTGIPIHVDGHYNIFQSMIYFPEIGDPCDSGGDIHLTKLLKDDSLLDVVKCKYKPNRCLIFPHHPSGWHFVTPRKSKFSRRGVGVIYRLNESLQEIPPKFFSKKT